jgi:serine/threonine-protein kinase
MASTERKGAVLAPELGKYRLIAELARGGMGNVYLAIARGPGGFHKLLVVKELKPEFVDDEVYVAMFLEEARLAARLIHPNIVQTNEVGSEGHRHYMTMEYLDGRSLYRVLRQFAREGRFPVGAHLRIVGEALLGLHHAHELRGVGGEPLDIVHRDVSPLNVVVTFDGQTKVLDFGIAKAADSSVETQAGVLKGRVAYMAPEQAVGAKVDRRADVYSAGVMLWEAAAGRRLWPGMNDVEILTQILRERPPALRSVVPDAPPELEAICARAMAHEPGDRYSTALALLEDLEGHLARRDDAPSMRQIGTLIGAAFAQERRRMGALVDDALARVQSGPHSGTVPTVQSRVMSSGTHSVPSPSSRGGGERVTSLSSLLAATPSGAAKADLPLHTAPSVAAAPDIASDEDVRRARRVAGGVAVAAFLVAGLGATALLHRPDPRPAPVAAVTPPSPAPAAATRPATVDIVVRVSPPSAEIAIDGRPASGNPFHARLPKDGEIHRVSAAADGYETKVEEVTFSADLAVDVSLEHRAPPQRAAPPPRWTPPVAPRLAKSAEPPRSDAPPPARTEVDPGGGRAPLRPIATTNPYGAP